MPIHASARLENVRARLGVWLSSLSLSGSPELVLEGGERGARDTGPFVRLSLEWLPGQARGHTDASTRADEQSVLVLLDLFWPTLTADAYAVERVASELVYELRALSLPLLDYASDPVTPPSVLQHPLRVLEVPQVQRLPPVDGYDRRRVSATARWFSLHD